MSLLVPSNELVSRVEAELEDVQHFMNVGELIQCCLLIKLGIQAIDGILGLFQSSPFLQHKPIIFQHKNVKTAESEQLDKCRVHAPCSPMREGCAMNDATHAPISQIVAVQLAASSGGH